MTIPPKKRASRGPTLAIVAKEAGVSKETVSHILGSKADRYHEETRQRVIAAAEKLNYRPNRAAQMMRGRRSNLIGVIHFGLSHQNAYKASLYLPQAIHASGYDVFVVDLSWLAENSKRAIDLLVESRVEGVVIIQMNESFGKDDLELLTRAGIPVVSLAGNEALGTPVVYGDSSVAISGLVNHLVALGRRKLLILTNTYTSRPTKSRIAGFRLGIEEVGGVVLNDVAELSEEGADGVRGAIVQISERGQTMNPGATAYTYTRQLIADDLLPDAILATNDHWAQGVFSAALEAGLRIPQDLAITGFDNASFGAHAPYYLTTAAPDVAAECEKVVEILLELIAGRALPQQRYVYPCKLVIRRSCGADHEEDSYLSPPCLPL